ncbi:GFA family protein [Falsihalocynthiibacter sp. BN13B15]|uniref:GFA family protein n=1 Tax=Falsihalocynthiibacter sp. BN13B15 TaxID=3240871 RepID=UPI00350FF6D1
MTKFTGGCLCGSVKYTCEAEPALVMNCHCSDCQKAMGSVFATTMFVPENKVTISGYPRSFNHGADSGSGMTKLFCENCGTQLFSKNTNRPGTLGIRAGTADDHSIVKPSANIYTDSAIPTTAMDPSLPKHRGMPG